MNDKKIYRAFENRYRGPRELIKSRLRIYLPFVEQLKSIYIECKAVDLGCGRGEWLELMAENGFEAHGVDLDEEMLTDCNERELSVSNEDAITYLQHLHAESLVLVSGFHIVEHLSFDTVQTLVIESFRVLKPGGLLILETPNVENLIVGTTNFYLDPTHQRPIPPLLLSFLPEYCRFARTKILRLQESPELANSNDVRLLDVIAGASPDYAVVAQKNALPEYLSLFDAAFAKEYGLTLDALAMRYETKIEQRFSDMESQLQSIYASRSWRITAPLRAAFDMLLLAKAILLNIPRTAKNVIKKLLDSILAPIIIFSLAHPTLKAWILAWMRRYPQLESWLHKFAETRGIIAHSTTSQIYSEEDYMPSTEPSRLTQSTCHIYADLKAAIERHKKGDQ
ncbi:MAG: class I SAM-dependent methyltransferase [Methanothrix sp.]